MGKAPFPQELGQAVQGDEFGGIFSDWLAVGAMFDACGMFARLVEVFFRGLAVLFEDVLHFFIDEAAVRADDRVRWVPRQDVALVVHGEYGRKRELVFVRAERTDVVAEAFGEHGDGAVDEVNACGALLGFAVDDIAFFDVM